jgi:uncharacterized short protein YbdD (DUF466 family)
MSPLNVAICTTTYLERQKCYDPGKKIISKKQLFDLQVKGQGLTKVIMVCDTPPYGHAPTYQISLTYLERQKCYGPDKKILFKKQFFDLEVKGQGFTKVITVHDIPPYGHAPTYQISLTYLERQKIYGPDKNILFKKQLFDPEVKGQGPTKVITVCNTLPYSHAPTYQINTI